MLLDDEVLRSALLPLPPDWDLRPGQRPAAVLAPVLRRDGADHLLFIERHAGLPAHAGQIAFPGGVREGDEDPAACALRESAEEIALPVRMVRILGALPGRSSSSAFRVHGIVGRVTGPVDLRPEPGEVASIFAVPFAELTTASRWQDLAYHLPRGRLTRPSPHFQHGPHLIWGLTGRLAKDLVDAVWQCGA